MSRCALKLQEVSKRFQNSNFELSNISFEVPCGRIVGLVGENGAGKTTLLRCVLQDLRPDSGKIEVFGKTYTQNEIEIKNSIGVVYNECGFDDGLTPMQIAHIMRNIYAAWKQEKFAQYLSKFHILPYKKVAELSEGMKKKLALAAAMSHAPKLLLLDEITSGLDPIAREEVLDIFLEFIQDEEHAILFSSHITADLDKIADYIVLIGNGRIILKEIKDYLLYQYGIMRCTRGQFKRVNENDILASRTKEHQIEILVKDRARCKMQYPEIVIDAPGIEEVLMLMARKDFSHERNFAG